MPERHPMTQWYDPRLLAATAFRVAVSTAFGRFADRREALAVSRPVPADPFDPHLDYAAAHPADQPFWFDYIADTGDGWEPTHAIADLLARDALHPEGAPEPLPRGRLLVMGGDQVYPDPSPDAYKERLIAPFAEACSPDGHPRWPEAARPDLYAIPGNHDWYDGLAAFSHLFCRRRIAREGEAALGRDGRVVAGRQTHQTRSYFALRLPHGWWLWGVDSQLAGAIDEPQVDFFRFVAERWMAPRSNLILCVADPAWQYVDPGNPEKDFANVAFLTRLAAAEGRTHRLRLVVSGDSHHYARHAENGLDYVTCGGGGAFLHPTHHLEDKIFDFRLPPPGVPAEPGEPGKPPPLHRRHFRVAKKAGSAEDALYPSRNTSRRLTRGNFLFAVRNWRFLFLLVPAYLVFIWTIASLARATAPAAPGRALSAALAATDGLPAAMLRFWRIAFLSPWPVILAALAAAGYIYFADATGWRRAALGLSHAAVQTLGVTATLCLVLLAFAAAPEALAIPAAAFAGGVVSATLTGVYLWFCLNVLSRHWNEAFSSLRIAEHKSLLRFRIAPDGTLTVFPLGLRAPRTEVLPHMIEPPVRIPASDDPIRHPAP